jgi:hypothetical protein
MIPVFVSSTFVDLKAHRAAVCDALRQGGFLDVAMEHLGARDERPQEECLRVGGARGTLLSIYLIDFSIETWKANGTSLNS